MNDADPIIDARALSRLQWSCRRGLLENDLIIQRFFDSHAPGLTLRQARLGFLGARFDTMTVLCILLFIGAMGKSAQLGLHTWLRQARGLQHLMDLSDPDLLDLLLRRTELPQALDRPEVRDVLGLLRRPSPMTPIEGMTP